MNGGDILQKEFKINSADMAYLLMLSAALENSFKPVFLQ